MKSDQALTDTMVSLIFHELRMPLTYIMSYASILAERSEGPQREWAQTILRNTVRMREALEDFTLLTEWSTSHFSDTPQQLDLHGALRTSVVQLVPLATVRNQTLIISPVSHPLKITSDAQILELLLITLISSAIKRTPAQGNVYAGVSQAGDTAMVTIQAGSDANDTDEGPHGRPDIGLILARGLTHALGGELHETETENRMVYRLVLPAEPCRRKRSTDSVTVLEPLVEQYIDGQAQWVQAILAGRE